VYERQSAGVAAVGLRRSKQMERLIDRVAIITGGAGGIGAATAERFTREGARVVLADIDESKVRGVAARLGTAATPMYMDAADQASVKSVCDETARVFGRIDILHNNHAWLTGMGDDRTAIDTDFEVWDRSMAVNLRGYFSACKYVLPHMIAGAGGAIINMASDSALAANFDHIAYNTAKAGIMALTMNVATQHGRQGVRCNAISPGLIVTPIVKERSPELVALVGRHNLINETGEPRDIAALAAFLASDDARFITGQIICCDGGLLAHLPQNADHLDYIARSRQDVNATLASGH
jgi:NAD(P)-dependent dehydrogenase (short-subunit alcohol dehydrogenase family)